MGRCRVVAALVVLFWSTAALADNVAEELYGQGMHAYFRGDYGQAYDYLNSALAAGSREPGVYYFRGLCELRLDREPEARIDFQRGAQAELTALNTSHLGRELSRVQGAPRMLLEQYRRQAHHAEPGSNSSRRKTPPSTFEPISPGTPSPNDAPPAPPAAGESSPAGEAPAAEEPADGPST